MFRLDETKVMDVSITYRSQPSEINRFNNNRTIEIKIKINKRSGGARFDHSGQILVSRSVCNFDIRSGLKSTLVFWQTQTKTVDGGEVYWVGAANLTQAPRDKYLSYVFKSITHGTYP